MWTMSTPRTASLPAMGAKNWARASATLVRMSPVGLRRYQSAIAPSMGNLARKDDSMPGTAAIEIKSFDAEGELIRRRVLNSVPWS